MWKAPVIERRNPFLRNAGGGILLGLTAGLLLGGLEFLSNWRFGALPPGRFGPAWRYGIAGVAVLTAASALGGLVVGLLLAAGTTAAEALAGNRREWRSLERWIFTLALSPLAAYAAIQAFSGRRARTLPAHDLLALGTGILLLGAWWLTVAILLALGRRFREERHRTWEPHLLALAGLAVACGLHEANRRILPGLYGFFHTGLALATWGAAMVCLHALYLSRPRARVWGPLAKPPVTLALFALSLLGGALAVRHLVLDRNLRPYALRRTVLVAKVLEATHRLGLLPGLPALEPEEAEEIRLPAATGPRLPGRDLVLVTVDALRRDRVGLYDPKHGHTPSIDAFFRSGIRFEWAFTPMPQTSYAITSLLAGSYVTNPQRASGRTRPTLPRILRQFGYKTAAFYPPAVFYIDRRLFRTYEQARYGFEYVKVMYHKTAYDDDAAGRIDQVLAFLRQWKQERARNRKPARRLFLWVHLFDPHHPYQPRAGHMPPGAGGSDLAAYESEIAYADAQVGRLLEELVRISPDAVFVLTSDHGEAFGEHDTSAHGTSLYAEQTLVPLLVRAKGLPGKVVKNPVSLADLAPTLLTLLDLPVPPEMDGIDRTPDMGTRDLATSESPPAFCELVTGRAHLLAAAHARFHLIQEEKTNTLELYDLASDPQEEHPLDLERDPKARKTARRLLAWLDAWRKGGTGGRKAPRPSALLERLVVLGPEERRGLARQLMDREDLPCADLARLWQEEADPEVRDRLAVPLTRCGHEKARAHLRSLVQRPDIPPRLLLAAGLALASVQDPEAAPALVAGYDDIASMETKKAVLETLGRLGSPKAAGLLLRELTHAGLASTAARALGRLNTRQTVPAMTAVLTAPRTQALVRQALARSLSQLGGPVATAALQRLVAKESRWEVLAEALAGLRRLGARIPLRLVLQLQVRQPEVSLSLPRSRSSAFWILADGNIVAKTAQCRIQCAASACLAAECEPEAEVAIRLAGPLPQAVRVYAARAPRARRKPDSTARKTHARKPAP